MKQVRGLLCAAILLLFLATGLAFTAPQFTCVNANNPEPMGGGVYKFNYDLYNDGQIPIYDVEISGFEYGWYHLESPNPYWTMDYVTGPMARFITDSAPCNYEQHIYGFSVYAGTPVIGSVTVGYSDQQHSIFTTGTTMFPLTQVPEPGTILAAISILGPAAMIFKRRK